MELRRANDLQIKVGFDKNEGDTLSARGPGFIYPRALGAKVLRSESRKISSTASLEEKRVDQDKEMNHQSRYIDARLAGIEGKLDARIEAMQRFQEQAEARFQRATERHETDIALARQQIHQEFKDARVGMASESQTNRKHSTQVALGTVAGVLAAFALVVTVAVGWISEQGGYSDMRLGQQQSAQEMNEFREAVQAIQQTQQHILERLPAAQEPPPSE